MTYNHAKALFSTARSPEMGKPLENNTRLFKRGEDYSIRLHRTDVVTIHPDGTYTLRDGGWRTVTTKDRINGYSPARLSQHDGLWYLYIGGGWDERIPWEGEATVDATGRPINF